ncbi:MAG: hypothetical protein IK075_01960 [Prevotella sp.]|nr:hypothetical protein [Prevotella sp.]
MNIKQIKNFQLRVLRMAGFLEFVQQVKNIVKAFRDSGEAGVSQLPEKVEAAYTPFVAGVERMDDAYKLSHASEFTKQIADEDTRRDSLYLALKNQVNMFKRFDFDTEKQAAATYLWNIMKKYGVDVDENYHEESVKLQQMLQELEADNTAGHHITTLGLTSLIAQLKTANEAVRTLLSQRNDERMMQEKAALANAREEADQTYRDLVLMINATAAIGSDPHLFDEVISQVNELIKYYRQYVAPKGTGGSDNTNGGGSNGSGNSGSGSNTGGNGGSQGSGTQNGGSGENGGSNTGGDNNGGGTSTGGNSGGGGDSGDDIPDQ